MFGIFYVLYCSSVVDKDTHFAGAVDEASAITPCSWYANLLKNCINNNIENVYSSKVINSLCDCSNE